MITKSKAYLTLLFILVCSACGFTPLHNDPEKRDVFKKIEIQTKQSEIGFLIKEALNENARYTEKGSIALKLNPSIKSSYGVITKENEITRYSVTLTVKYTLINIANGRIYFDSSETSTSDYSAAVTYTGFATEVAKKDTYKRLAKSIAEKITTQIIIHFR